MFSQILKMNSCRLLQRNSDFARIISNSASSLAKEQLASEYSGVVLGLYEHETVPEDPKITAAAENYNSKLKGKVMELIKSNSLKGRSGDINVFNNIPDEIQTLCIAGLGPIDSGYNEMECIDSARENVRIAAALGCRALEKAGCQHIFVDSMHYSEQAAEASFLSMWRFEELKELHKMSSVPCIDLFDSQDIEMWKKGILMADAQNKVRRMCDMPANLMTPTLFAQEAVNLLCSAGASVDVREMDWIEAQNMNSFAMIARTSCQPPLFLEIKYCGSGADTKPILLVGEGLTFNTGGLCLKPKEDMSLYRSSMAGGAVVVATINAIAAMSLPINVTGLIPLCENMSSGYAVRPGDVVKGLNGKNILIDDSNKTTAMILADAMVYGQNIHKPNMVITMGHVSRSVEQSLAASATGVFTNNEYLWSQLSKAGAITGDRVWRMPLWDYFTFKVTDYSKFDISSRGYGYGGCCKGAAFLREFVPGLDFIHMDLKGVGMASRNKYYPYLTRGRMTGRPTRTLIQFLHQLACPDEQFKNLK